MPFTLTLVHTPYTNKEDHVVTAYKKQHLDHGRTASSIPSLIPSFLFFLQLLPNPFSYYGMLTDSSCNSVMAIR